MLDSTAKRKLVIEAIARHGNVSSEVIKSLYNYKSPKKINTLMRMARTMKEKGILERSGRGEYTMATQTMKEQKNIEKIQRAIKLGRHIIIEGKKKDGSEVVRIGAPKEITMSKTGSRSVLIQDNARNSWRKFRLDLIDNIRYAQ